MATTKKNKSTNDLIIIDLWLHGYFEYVYVYERSLVTIKLNFTLHNNMIYGSLYDSYMVHKCIFYYWPI